MSQFTQRGNDSLVRDLSHKSNTTLRSGMKHNGFKILCLSSAYNALTQRVELTLEQLGYQVEVAIVANGEMIHAVIMQSNPDLVIAPMLKAIIPTTIWQQYCCLIVHPGIVGDRGAYSLDFALLGNESEWGVTILQANQEKDGGDIWATVNFPMRSASKSSLYNNEVSDASLKGVLHALEKIKQGQAPLRLNYADPAIRGSEQAPMHKSLRRIEWQKDPIAVVLAKSHASDGVPGASAYLGGELYFIYDVVASGEAEDCDICPGQIIAKRNNAILVSCLAGQSVWIGALKLADKTQATGKFKQAATTLLKKQLTRLPELSYSFKRADFTSRQSSMPEQIPAGLLNVLSATSNVGYQDIYYVLDHAVSYLYFNFYNGAMSTLQCQRLLSAYRELATNPQLKVIVLCGGYNFWSNGIHLNVIEGADNSALEAWQNINAIDDVVEAIIRTEDKLTISFIQGNAGAGGVILGLAADIVLARDGVIFNPHYKKMGLFGSEYWTYLLPRRVGEEMALNLTSLCRPLDCNMALNLGLIDEMLSSSRSECYGYIYELSLRLVDDFSVLIQQKQARLLTELAHKPLQDYRNNELSQMLDNIFMDNWNFNRLRRNFVHKIVAPECYGIINLPLSEVSFFEEKHEVSLL